MIEVNATVFTLLAEGFVVVSLLLLATVYSGTRRKSRDRKALRALVGNINAEAGERLQQTRAVFDDGDEASSLCRQERDVCQAFIVAYDKRAEKSVPVIYAQLKSLVDAYQQQVQELRQSVAAAAADEQPGTEPKDRVISKLKSDFENVSRELEITKTTMAKMLREYSSMFAGGAEEASDDNDDVAMVLGKLESDDVDGANGAPEATIDAEDKPEAASEAEHETASQPAGAPGATPAEATATNR